jgi:hypothetical protein
MRRIVYVRPPGHGWEPITMLARLAGHVLEARVDEVLESRYGPREHYALHWPRMRRGDEILVIAAHPGHLQEITKNAGWWLRGHRTVAAWVIDSFWSLRIPGIALDAGHFDHFFITDAELVDHYRDRTGAPTTFLPVGTDALRRGNDGPVRPVDLQRIGREPEEWSDDALVAADALLLGVTYGGSPAFHEDAAASQLSVHEAMSQAKFTLAFSNRVNPMGYTHPDREYITSRWFDALANGASVAGEVPRCHAAKDLLWPEATLDLGTTNRDEGLRAVKTAVDAWSPAAARLNHLRSLERLDWRWRIDELASTLGWRTASLERELTVLRERIGDLTAGVG